MTKEELENIINEYQNLETDEERTVFFEKYANIISAQKKEENTEGLETIKLKVEEIEIILDNLGNR